MLPPSSWAADWPEKYEVDLALGLRRVSDADLQTAKAEAVKFAVEMYPAQAGADPFYDVRIEAYNDALMRWMIVRGTSDPQDSRLNAAVFSNDEENVRLALTKNAIRYAWDEFERFHLANSPIVPEATDEELAALAALLATRPFWERLSGGQKARFRKLARFLLTELKEADPGYDADDELEEIEDAIAAEAAEMASDAVEATEA